MKLKEIHHQAITMMISGMKNCDIAKELNTAHETVSRWRSDFDFQAALNQRLREHQEDSQQRLRALTDSALQAIESVMNDSEDDKTRLQAALKIIELTRLTAPSIGSDNPRVLARDAELERSLDEFSL